MLNALIHTIRGHHDFISPAISGFICGSIVFVPAEKINSYRILKSLGITARYGLPWAVVGASYDFAYNWLKYHGIDEWIEWRTSQKNLGVPDAVGFQGMQSTNKKPNPDNS